MKTYPTSAVLDGDIIGYRLAFKFEATGFEEDELAHEAAVEVSDWTPPGVSDVYLAFSCSREKNFRRNFLPEYKEHRNNFARPTYLYEINQYLKETYPVLMEDGLEADDIMGMNQLERVTVTIDKDLLSVPGWLWNPHKDGMASPRWISHTRALGHLCLQWMTGDRTDNIPGIRGIGPMKSWDALVQSGPPSNWLWAVLAMYESRGYTQREALCSYRGVYILRKNEIKFPLD